MLKTPQIRKLLSRLFEVFRLFPLTPLGVLVITLSVFILYQYAYGKLDLVILVMGYSGIGLTLFSVLMVSLSALLIRLKWKKQIPIRNCIQTETQEHTLSNHPIPQLSYNPFIQIELNWHSVSAQNQKAPKEWIPQASLVTQNQVLNEQFIAQKRGMFSSVERNLVIKDILGLANISLRKKDPIELEIQPHLGKLSSQSPLFSFTGGNGTAHPKGAPSGDRIDLRQYNPGDPARFIHWKAFGRNRKLITRIPENAMEPLHRTAAFLLTGKSDEAPAAATKMALTSNSLGKEWILSVEGTHESVSELSKALHLIMTPPKLSSKPLINNTSSELQRFARKIEKLGYRSLILFAHPDIQSWIDSVIQIKQTSHLSIKVVVCMDGTPLKKPKYSWARFLFRQNDHFTVLETEINERIHQLQSADIEVVLVDRESGHTNHLSHSSNQRTAA